MLLQALGHRSSRPGLHRGMVLASWLAALALVSITATGCQKLNFSKLTKSFSPRSQSPDEKDKAKDDEFVDGTKLTTPLVGDYTSFSGLQPVVLEGVGLVVGLNGTGGDPPPSPKREALLDDLRRREVDEPNRLIASADTALVVVRAYLPPLVRKGEKFDIEVRIEGDAGTSLNGGRLMETILSETAIVAGKGQMKGHMVAKAKGPVLISTGEGKEENMAGVLRRGWVLGGGTSMIDRDMAIYLKSDFRNFRNVTRVADRVGQRFYAYNEHGVREPLAKAQTDQRIVLKVHPRYKENWPRYQRVIQAIAFRETPVEQRVRLQRLEKDLMVPEKSERASLQLEAIGNDAIPILKSGLKSSSLECQFHSATALAYLEVPDGIAVLKQAALKERAFRVFSFAALSTLPDPQSHIVLRELMSAQADDQGKILDSAETRYGAFRALWTLDEHDPYIEGEYINQEFHLHPLDTKGEPMVHITHRKRSEIVLFNKDQEFITPMALRAGNHIMVTCRPGSDRVSVTRFGVRNDHRLECSRKVEDVIRAAAKLGASYPDVAQLLVQADRQGNLPGRFEIDALPQAGRVYYRDSEEEGDGTRAGKPTFTPNLYQRNTDGEPGEEEEEQSEPEEKEGTASLVDARTEAKTDKKKWSLWPW